MSPLRVYPVISMLAALPASASADAAPVLELDLGGILQGPFIRHRVRRRVAVAEGRLKDVAQLVVAGNGGLAVDGGLVPKRFIPERFDAFIIYDGCKPDELLVKIESSFLLNSMCSTHLNQRFSRGHPQAQSASPL